jgi:hypothetical protein
MLCRHCQRAPISRPRKLCWSCFYTPGVRELYPSTSKFGRRGLGNFFGKAPLPPFPTQALPGSADKVALLTQRAQERQQLFHPDDATCATPIAISATVVAAGFSLRRIVPREIQPIAG